MKKQINLILFTLVLGVVAVSAESDCVTVSRTVTLEVSEAKYKVLEIVSSHVSSSPNCACEIVKSAIIATDAKSKDVAAIVEAAILSAPGQNRLISQCAIAAAPDAASDIHDVLAKLDPNSGDSLSGSKSGKSAKSGNETDETAAVSDNPLDFPGLDPTGSPLNAFNADGTAGSTTNGGGGMGGGAIGSLLGRIPAGGLPGGFFGSTPNFGIVLSPNPPIVTNVNP